MWGKVFPTAYSPIRICLFCSTCLRKVTLIDTLLVSAFEVVRFSQLLLKQNYRDYSSSNELKGTTVSTQNGKRKASYLACNVVSRLSAVCTGHSSSPPDTSYSLNCTL